MKEKVHFTNIRLAVTIVMVGLMTTACEYKELEEANVFSSVKVNFLWDKVDSIPGAMRVVFYPVDNLAKASMTKGYTFFDLPRSIWPATIQLPAGVYNVVAWNNDYEGVYTSMYNSQEGLYATTSNYSTRGSFDTPTVLDSIYNHQEVMDCPDYMVHAINQEEEVKYEAADQEITLVPDSMVVTVEYKIHGIGGLSWVKEVRGAVNNVAGKRYIAFDNLTEDTVAVMFDCNFNVKDSLVYGSFYVFGIEPTKIQDLKHKMVMFFWMDAGKIYLPIDVTEVFQAFLKEDKKIVIDVPSLGIDLRDYVSTKNTFDVNLDEWENINVDVGF